jgi:hypothetical protein
LQQAGITPAGPASGVASSAIVYHGITPHLNFLNQQNIPDYFKVTYCTGYSKIPTDIINMIGKLTAILNDIINYGLTQERLNTLINSNSENTNYLIFRPTIKNQKFFDINHQKIIEIKINGIYEDSYINHGNKIEWIGTYNLDVYDTIKIFYQ